MADVAEIARRLGCAQKRAVLSLSGEWGASCSHAATVRLFYRYDIPQLVNHKHMGGNSWKLRPLGLAVRAHLLENGQ